MRRRTYLAGIGGTGLASLAGCVAGQDTIGGGDEEFSLEMATPQNPGDPITILAELFIEKVEEESDGDAEIDFTEGGAYGGEEEHADLVRDQGLDAYAGGTGPWNRFAQDMYFFQSPYIFEDWDHFETVMYGDLGEEAEERLLENGDIRLTTGHLYRGSRNIIADVEIRDPEDTSGLSLRAPQYEDQVWAYEAWGANVAAVSLDELYSALQTGTVDAAEQPAGDTAAFSFYEVRDVYSLTQHLFSTGNIYMNNSYYEGLDETYQDIIDEKGIEASEEANEQNMEEEEEIIYDVLEDEYGMTIVDDVDHDAFIEVTEPATEEMFDELWDITREEFDEAS